MKLLLASQAVDINASCPLGRRPIHMVLTAKSRAHSHACLTYLLEHGALPNVYDVSSCSDNIIPTSIMSVTF